MTNLIKRSIETYRVTKQIPSVFAILLPYHILATVGLYLAISAWSWWYLLYFGAGWIVFGGIGDAVMLHRVLSHKSVVIRPWQKPILYWISCMTGQGSPIWWSALHRGYHHLHSDKELDLHSPTKGVRSAYMGWMLNVSYNTVNLKYAVDLLRDKQLVFFHKNYNRVIWTSVILLLLINPMFCLCFCIIPCVFALHTENTVNCLCHLQGKGYRGFELNDDSQNVWYLGLFGWGQGWHNNHHFQQKSFDFGTTISKRAFEFDPCLLLLPFVASWKETNRVWALRRSA